MTNPDLSRLVLEACVETLEQALLAEKCGAHRIELCADLSVGGLTPSKSLIEETVSKVHIPVMVMIRPRAGGFGYTPEELEEMQRSVAFCKSAGAVGVVFGFLDERNEVDLGLTKQFAALAKPLEVTFHKAIDDTPDPVNAVGLLSSLKTVERVLTSGGAPSALAGCGKLKEMLAVSKQSGSLKILAAGGITRENLVAVHRAIGAEEYHGRKIVF